MGQVEYTVSGMTCGHCVGSVTEHVTKVEGVTGVDVDLVTKAVTVTGEAFDDTAVRDAIAEAGYEAEPDTASA